MPACAEGITFLEWVEIFSLILEKIKPCLYFLFILQACFLLVLCCVSLLSPHNNADGSDVVFDCIQLFPVQNSPVFHVTYKKPPKTIGHLLWDMFTCSPRFPLRCTGASWFADGAHITHLTSADHWAQHTGIPAGTKVSQRRSFNGETLWIFLTVFIQITTVTSGNVSESKSIVSWPMVGNSDEFMYVVCVVLMFLIM